MATREQTRFGDWLDQELTNRGLFVRALAREIDPDNVERVRRSLNRYLHDGALPGRPMRKAIADALGVDAGDLPDEEDESG